jgi:hypothetical protein
VNPVRCEAETANQGAADVVVWSVGLGLAAEPASRGAVLTVGSNDEPGAQGGLAGGGCDR